jgi:predicted N-acetyltransferase YhbS
MEIRPLRVEELEAAAEVADNAFLGVIEELTGRRPARPFFPVAGLGLRKATDPDGCLVAVHSGRLAGVLFSVRRGSQAWLGPVAVDFVMQGRGIGQELVEECLRLWATSGVRLRGLETFSQSPAHVHLYSKLGFRPGWTGVHLKKPLSPAEVPVAPARPLQHPRLPLPALDFLYPGFNPAREVRATLERGAGRVFATDHGLALLHLRDALHVTPSVAFIPLLVADGRETFVSLLEACEQTAGAAGKAAIAIRIPGTALGAFDALRERGYRAGGAMLRMKSGEDLDYDRDAWYADDWL